MPAQAVKVAVITNVIIFLVFSYLGATLEHLSYYINKKSSKLLANPIITGFPLYGLGALAVVATNRLLNPITKNIVLHSLAYGAVLSAIELGAGVVVKAGPRSRNAAGEISSWDYSNQYLNYRGIISLESFVKWALLGNIVVLMYNYLQRQLTCGLTHCLSEK